MPPRRRSGDRAVLWIVAVGSTAMLLWMARGLFGGQIPFTGDLLHLHYPLRDFYAGALAQGHRFDWMPSLYGGFDVAGQGELGAYHPLHWLLYRVLPLDTAFGVELVAAYPFLLVGMWLFLRRWCERPAAAFGAMLFAFCGFNLLHGVHPNMVSVVAHMPWALWAIHGAYASGGWRSRMRSATALAALTGSALLLGHPHAFWFSAVAEGGYALLLMSTSTRSTRVQGSLAILLGKTLGVALGAIQLLGSMRYAQHSTRLAFDPEFATTFSLPPAYLWQLFHPYLFWDRVLRWNEAPGAGDEFAVYGGAVTLILCAWWLAQRAQGRVSESWRVDRLAVGVAALAVVSAWMATGRFGGLYYVQTWMPLVGQFRVPARYLVLMQFGMAVLAALALARLMWSGSPGRSPGLSSGRRALWAPWAVVAATALSAVWLVWGRREVAGLAWTTLGIAALGPLLFGTAALLLTLATGGRRWAVAGLVVVAVADAAAYGLGGVIAWHDFLTRPQVVELLGPEDSRPPASEGRVAHGGFPNLYTLVGYRFLDGYMGLAPARTLDYRSAAALRVARVTYAHDLFQQQAQLTAVQPFADEWVRLPAPLPRVRLVTDSRVSHQPALDLEGLDVDRTALVARALHLDGGPAGSVAMVRDDPGTIDVRTQTTGRQLLVVAESFDDGWIATVDGHETPVEAVYGDWIGCVVPAGEHTVSLQFRPTYLRRGGAVSLGAAGLIVVLLLVTARAVPPERGIDSRPFSSQRARS